MNLEQLQVKDYKIRTKIFVNDFYAFKKKRRIKYHPKTNIKINKRREENSL